MKPDPSITAWAPVAGPIIASFIAVAGWFAGHKFSARRDTANRLMSLRVKELLDVYRLLESASGGEASATACRAIEKAVSDLQLLGSDDLVAQTRELARSFEGVHTESVTIEDLMQTLLRSIRRDLGLSVRKEPTLHLSLTYTPPTREAPEQWEHVEITGD